MSASSPSGSQQLLFFVKGTPRILDHTCVLPPFAYLQYGGGVVPVLFSFLQESGEGVYVWGGNREGTGESITCVCVREREVIVLVMFTLVLLHCCAMVSRLTQTHAGTGNLPTRGILLSWHFVLWT